MADWLKQGFGTLAGAVGALLVLLFLALQFGLWAPVVREHCFAEGRPGSVLKVDSSWELRMPAVGAADSSLCVRNTVTREALGAIGVWPLENPQAQVEEAAVVNTRDNEGEAAAGYVETVLDIKRRSDAAAVHFSRSLRAVDSRDDFVAVLTSLIDKEEQVISDLRAAAPPPGELTQMNALFIRINERMLTAARDFATTIDIGTRSQMIDAAEQFQGRHEQALNDFQSEAEALQRAAEQRTSPG